MNVVLYGRFSCEKQNEQSIEGQLEACRNFANSKGYTIINEYTDVAMSGRDDKRPSLQRMVQDSESGIFQAVIVWKFDRFFRSCRLSSKYREILKNNGVDLISAMEYLGEGPQKIILQSLFDGMAEFYSANLAENVIRGMGQNAQKCLSNGGTIPLGYKIIDKRYQIDEQTAPYVKKVFEMYAGGERAIDIAAYLNERGIRTAQGAKFNKSSFKTMLQNPKYIGIYSYSGYATEGGVPRIISDELFNAVAERLRKNKKAPARAKANMEYLLTTKLFCGHCKDLMVGSSTSKKGGVYYYYYVCKSTILKAKTCDKKRVNKETIEELILKLCREQLENKNIDKLVRKISSISKKQKESLHITRLSEALKSNEAQRKNLMQSLKECEYEGVRKGIYAELNDLDKAKAELEKDLAIEKSHSFIPSEEQLRTFFRVLKAGDKDDLKTRKALIDIFINAVYLYDDNNGRNRKITVVFNSGKRPVTIENIPIDDISLNFERQSSYYIEAKGSPHRKLIRTFTFLQAVSL
ncbi:MAG: recombinase family protein [Oscillospiraceae bacterium]|jgi:DNA invertase Pin-like site-specific DNA recombinase|nr:recombinase family protein [Oscillospiraceae bacterium]